MSSLTILCPNGHRQKVTTTPNMSLLQVLETVCKKKGFDPRRHGLQHHRRNMDLSSSIRFCGAPNNSLLEMVELGDEMTNDMDGNVTVCLQIPSGERLIDEFPSTSTLDQVVSKWREKLGECGEGEEPVVVYMRTETVGSQLSNVSLRTLGLTSGKGLFRFFYKRPEVLKDQANVYSMKSATKPEESKTESRHLPMRLEPSTLGQLEEKSSSQQLPTASVAPQQLTSVENEKPDETVVVAASSDQTQKNSQAVNPVAGPSKPVVSTPASVTNVPVPDSTSQSEVVDPVLVEAGPNKAVIFDGRTDGAASKMSFDDDEDSFFDHTLDEVRVLYKDLRLAVKQMEQGQELLTKEMRESQEEGAKLALLGRYKSSIIRIQFPDRLTVQGIFAPNTTIAELKAWLQPLLSSPDIPFQLYTAPPRLVLEEASSLLDLNLFPAALVHFSSRLTQAPSEDLQPLLSSTYTANLSNVEGANMAASQHRKGGKKRETGISGGSVDARSESQPIPSTSSDSRSSDSQPLSSKSSKMPKWFKPAKEQD